MNDDYKHGPYCWNEEIVKAAKLLDLTPEEVNGFMERKFRLRRQHRRTNFGNAVAAAEAAEAKRLLWRGIIKA